MMIKLSKYIDWEEKYDAMYVYLERFLATQQLFRKLLKSFSNLEGLNIDHYYSNFSHTTAVYDSEYFGVGVQFIIDYVEYDDELIVDFQTFLIALKQVVDIYLDVYQIEKEEKEEIESLYQIIQKKILA